jgi:hypothetical protein
MNPAARRRPARTMRHQTTAVRVRVNLLGEGNRVAKSASAKPRADDSHFTFQHVPEFWQFIDASYPKPLAKGGRCLSICGDPYRFSRQGRTIQRELVARRLLRLHI